MKTQKPPVPIEHAPPKRWSLILVALTVGGLLSGCEFFEAIGEDEFDYLSKPSSDPKEDETTGDRGY